MIDIHSIGAGRRLDRLDRQRRDVARGPDLAARIRAPLAMAAADGEATVTDANVVLGRINPKNFLGGRMRLDAAAALAAIAQLAKAIGTGDRGSPPWRSFRSPTTICSARLRAVLLQRGLDPREFTLVASGGAGPVHTCELMRLASIPRSLVPNSPGQFSAFGFIMTDARVDKHRTVQQTSNAFSGERATRGDDRPGGTAPFRN